MAAQPTLSVKGRTEPVQTYLVRSAKPRAYRIPARAVADVETHTHGRKTESNLLQEAYRRATSQGQTRVVLVIGEAGIGKSRLLEDFSTWLDLLPEVVTYFRGRAAPSMQGVAYGLLRDLFAYRFGILESDPATTALAKFREGMQAWLNADQADVVGHFIGFAFGAAGSRAVRTLLGSPFFGQTARSYLVECFRAIAQRPTVMLLEDLQWADDSSLELVQHIVAEVPDGRLLIAAAARPQFMEHHPNWQGSACLELGPLSPEAARALIGEVLHGLPQIPETLSKLILESSGRNPFFVEELIEFLIEEGAIVRPETQGTDQEWRLEWGRLEQVRVPPTLVGMLQARLDSLSVVERAVVQRSAVIGRHFWDAAVAELSGDEGAASQTPGDLAPTLERLCARDLLVRVSPASFAGTREYAFKHALLREVTLDTILHRVRRGYHAQAAHWLEEYAGERVTEYLELIAGHYEAAGQHRRAAEYLLRAGEEAFKVSAYRDALAAYDRALRMIAPPASAAQPQHPEGPDHLEIALLVQSGLVCARLSEYGTALERFQRGLRLAGTVDDCEMQAAALNGLSWVACERGEYQAAATHGEAAWRMAQASGDRAGAALAAENLYRSAWRRGALSEGEEYAAESLRLHREIGDRRGQASALSGLGILLMQQGRLDEAERCFDTSLAVARELGEPQGEYRCLINLGEIARRRGQFATAREYYEQGLPIARKTSARRSLVNGMFNLALVHARMGEDEVAWRYLRDVLREAQAIGALPWLLSGLALAAELYACAGQPVEAAMLFGFCTHHPAWNLEDAQENEPMLTAVRAALPVDVFEQATSLGTARSLEATIAAVLAGAVMP